MNSSPNTACQNPLITFWNIDDMSRELESVLQPARVRSCILGSMTTCADLKLVILSFHNWCGFDCVRGCR